MLRVLIAGLLLATLAYTPLLALLLRVWHFCQQSTHAASEQGNDPLWTRSSAVLALAALLPTLAATAALWSTGLLK